MESLAHIVKAAQQGDRDAFEAVVARFTDYAHQRAYAVLGDRQLAEDVAQDAFAEAFLNLQKLREPAAFPGWFRRIVIKRIDRVIRRKRVPTAPLIDGLDVESPDAGPDRAADEASLRATLSAAVESLPEHEQDIARRYYFLQEAQKEIAEDFALPVSTIKKRLYSSRRRLNRHLGDFGETDHVTADALPLAEQLFAATRNGYAGRVQTILDANADLVRSVNDDGLGILLYAAHSAHYSGNASVVDLLVARGAPVDLYSAAALGLKDHVAYTIKKAPRRLNETGPWDRTPLHWAVSGGHDAVTRMLANHGAHLDTADRWGCTPLHLAAELGHGPIVEYLIDQGADPTARLKNGKTVLHLAAQSGRRDVVKLLIQNGAAFDIFAAASLGMTSGVHKIVRREDFLLNARLPFGATPLHMAAESGQNDMARFLVELGAELDLVCAAELGWVDEVERLLADAPDAVGAKAGSFGFTALHTATSKGRRDLARLLLANGAPVNATDDMYQKTPLGEALYFGNESMARLLYQFGADR